MSSNGQWLEVEDDTKKHEEAPASPRVLAVASRKNYRSNANKRFNSNISYALRTCAAAALAFILSLVPQTFFPLTFFAALVAMVALQPTWGSTYPLCKEIFIGSMWGSFFGSILAAAVSFMPYTIAAILSPVLIFLFVSAFGHPIVPRKPFASLFLFLSIGLACNGVPWYFILRFFGTNTIGLLCSLLASLLPLPSPAFVMPKVEKNVAKACVLTEQMLTTLWRALSEYDNAAAAAGDQLSRELEDVVSELDGQLASLKTELCGKRNIHAKKIALLKGQRDWLVGLRRSITWQVYDEQVSPDHELFVKLVRGPIEKLLECYGDVILNRKPVAPETVKGLIDELSSLYNQVRLQLFYRPVQPETIAHTPKFSNSLRRNAFLFNFFHLSSLLAVHVGPPRVVVRPPLVPRPRIGLSTFKQSLKLGLALAIASLWFVVEAFKDHALGKGVWCGVTICFVSSPDVGAAFVKCADRLQGNMLACAFSLILITSLGDNIYLSAICALPWIFVTALFRSSPDHGYAALCAAMTVPGLLFGGGLELGQSHGLQNFLMARVEMTVLGVGLYLLIECLIWPVDPIAIVQKESAAWFTSFACFLRGTTTSVLSLGAGHVDLIGLENVMSTCEMSRVRGRSFITTAANTPTSRGYVFPQLLHLQLQEEEKVCGELMGQVVAALKDLKIQITSTSPCSVLYILRESAKSVSHHLDLCTSLVLLDSKLNLGPTAKDTDYSARAVSISAGFREFHALRERFKRTWADEMRQRWVAGTAPISPCAASASSASSSATSSSASTSSSSSSSSSSTSASSSSSSSFDTAVAPSSSFPSESSLSEILPSSGGSLYTSPPEQFPPSGVEGNMTRPIFDQKTQLAAGAFLFAIVEMCTSLKRIGSSLEKL